MRAGSQLIVSRTQEAVLLRSGKALTLYGPGRHTLATGNIPLLDKLVGLPFGGDTPFPAEVWFVERTARLDVPWETVAPIQLRDSQYGVSVPCQARGQFGISVTDSVVFLTRLVGTLPSFSHDAVKSYFRGIVLARSAKCVADYLGEQQIPVLEAGGHLLEMSLKVEAALAAEFLGYGLRLEAFRLTGLAPDGTQGLAKVTKALADKAQMDILGVSYREIRELDIMEEAARHSGASGNFAGAGVGMGVGMAMGQRLAERMEPAAYACLHCGRLCKSIYSFCPKCGREIHPGDAP